MSFIPKKIIVRRPVPPVPAVEQSMPSPPPANKCTVEVVDLTALPTASTIPKKSKDAITISSATAKPPPPVVLTLPPINPERLKRMKEDSAVPPVTEGHFRFVKSNHYRPSSPTGTPPPLPAQPAPPPAKPSTALPPTRSYSMYSTDPVSMAIRQREQPKRGLSPTREKPNYRRRDADDFRPINTQGIDSRTYQKPRFDRSGPWKPKRQPEPTSSTSIASRDPVFPISTGDAGQDAATQRVRKILADDMHCNMRDIPFQMPRNLRRAEIQTGPRARLLWGEKSDGERRMMCITTASVQYGGIDVYWIDRRGAVTPTPRDQFMWLDSWWRHARLHTLVLDGELMDLRSPSHFYPSESARTEWTSMFRVFDILYIKTLGDPVPWITCMHVKPGAECKVSGCGTRSFYDRQNVLAGWAQGWERTTMDRMTHTRPGICLSMKRWGAAAPRPACVGV